MEMVVGSWMTKEHSPAPAGKEWQSSEGCIMEWDGAVMNGTGNRRPIQAFRRRARQPVKRCRTIRFALSDEEFREVGAAAERAGLAKGAYAAQVVLSAARSATIPTDSPLREALGEFMRAAGLVRRIGVNLNQAVAKLNATGQRSADLLPYAAESLRRTHLLDQAAEEVRKRIRQ